MKQPQIRSIASISSYADQGGGYAYRVENTAGNPVAGSWRILFMYNWNGGISGVPGDEGTTHPVPGWTRIFGAYGGIATGFHVFHQWWQPGQPDSMFYSAYQSPAGTEAAYIGLQLVTIDGVDKIKPFEVDDTDPNGNIAGQGYSELDGTTPDVNTTGSNPPTAIELILFGVATLHDTGANNITHRTGAASQLTLQSHVWPTFPSGGALPPGSPMGNGVVMSMWAQLRAHPGPSPNYNRQIWRYVGTEFEELAASDPSAPDIDYGTVSFRIAIRGTTPSTAIMI